MFLPIDVADRIQAGAYGDFTRPHYETKETYLAKGKEIYEWAVKNLVDSNTGEVADSKHGEGNPAVVTEHTPGHFYRSFVIAL